MDRKEVRIEKTYFRNDSKYGRTTTLIDVKTGKTLISVMGIATKKDCIATYEGLQRNDI